DARYASGPRRGRGGAYDSCQHGSSEEQFRPMKKAVKTTAQIEKASKSLHRVHSSIVIDGPDRAPSRAMLHPVGFTAEDFKKSQIGIASTWSMVTPCNMHIDKLAIEAAHGANEAGGKAVIFNTITISDGISMGTEGMKYSLV